jgi:hypothetical protein
MRNDGLSTQDDVKTEEQWFTRATKDSLSLLRSVASLHSQVLIGSGNSPRPMVRDGREGVLEIYEEGRSA